MMPITDLERHLAFEIRSWQRGGATNFTVQLFSLMGKADWLNFKALAMGFPTEAQIYKEWFHAESQEAFFKKYGVPTDNTRNVTMLKMESIVSKNQHSCKKWFHLGIPIVGCCLENKP